MSRRQHILALKQKMDLNFLDKLEEKSQEFAYDMYLELQDLKETNEIDIPQSLLSKITNLIEEYNELILNKSESDKLLKNTTELLRKEIQQKIYFENKYKMETQNNEILTSESDKQLQVHKKFEVALNNKIHKQDVEISQLKLLKNKVQNQDAEISQLKIDLMRCKLSSSKTTQSNQDQMKKVLSVAKPQVTHRDSGSSQQNIQHEVSLLEEMSATAVTTVANIETTAEDIVHADVDTEPETSTRTALGSTGQNHPPLETDNQDNIVVKNVFLIGDSHCREMHSCIKQYVKSDSRVNCIFHPGKTITYVVDAIKPSKLPPDTQICIFAGTNDVFKTSFEDITRSFQKLYNKCKQFKVLIILIPPRYDRRNLNPHIVKLNSKLKHLTKTFENFDFIDPTNFVQLQHFSSDGLHLNLKGKNLVSRKIVMKTFGRLFNNKTYNSNNNNYYNRVNTNKTGQQLHDGNTTNRYHSDSQRKSRFNTQSYRVPSRRNPVQCTHQSNLPCLIHGDVIPPPFTPHNFPPLPLPVVSTLPPPPFVSQFNNMNPWNLAPPNNIPLPPSNHLAPHVPMVPYHEMPPPQFCPPSQFMAPTEFQHRPQFSPPPHVVNQNPALNFHHFGTSPQ
uniref:SGNH hydrolase-type esterase domain-containing protein n=1 Tax=Cacopsylla melanoneura TaxID=428564 RepID=A0A8D9E5J3_9HEMI